MGFTSIWHWIIVLIFLVLLFLIFVFLVFRLLWRWGSKD